MGCWEGGEEGVREGRKERGSRGADMLLLTSWNMLEVRAAAHA
jgi:hypothetical protein